MGVGPSSSGPGIEQKLQVQQQEIGQLLAENQRLAATNVALRQELAAAQGEIQRLKQALGEKDGAIQRLADKSGKMEADLRSTEPMRAELHQARIELQNVSRARADLEQVRSANTAQIQQMTQDIQRMRPDLQQIPALRQELDSLQQELQRARQGVEYEQKANGELVEQKTAMEKNLVSMAREVESLKAQLANLPKQAPPPPYVVNYGGPPLASSPGDANGMYSSGLQQNQAQSYASQSYGDPYGTPSQQFIQSSSYTLMPTLHSPPQPILGSYGGGVGGGSGGGSGGERGHHRGLDRRQDQNTPTRNVRHRH